MFFESLFSLLDDIATILDDVAAMSKVALKKTSGVVGDDLALNAEQVTGFSSNRELPVVWAVAKGSILNKAILVPAALFISAVLPWLVTPLLMLGGAYLCFEGAEKVLHKFFHNKLQEETKAKELLAAVSDPKVDLVQFEKEKIKGAIRTDFILSAEVIVISLGALSESSFEVRVGSLVVVAMLMTLVVYGLVAGIVKLDDFGLWLMKKGYEKSASAILAVVPKMMRAISWVGLLAMFLVGGGIIAHGLPWVERTTQKLGAFEWVGTFGVGLLTGLLFAGLFWCVQHIRSIKNRKA